MIFQQVYFLQGITFGELLLVGFTFKQYMECLGIFYVSATK